MAENTATPAQENQQQKPAAAVKVGEPVAAQHPFQLKESGAEPEKKSTLPTETSTQPAAASSSEGNQQPSTAAAPSSAANVEPGSVESAAPQMTEEQVKKFFEAQGIPYTSMDDLKSKLNPEKELTEEQKTKLRAEHEKAMLDLHITKGGTPEGFVQLKAIKDAEIKTLATASLETEMAEAGLSKEKIKDVIKKMHLDVSDEDLARMDDEDKAEIEKERTFGLKQLEKKGLFIQQSAKDYWDDLAEELKSKDAEKQKTEQYLSKVEDTAKKFERKQTIDLGEYEGQKLGSVVVEFPEDVIEEAKKLLSTESIKNNFLTPDGTFNAEFFLPHFVRSLAQVKAAKHIHLNAQTQTINAFGARFDSKRMGLGSASGQVAAKGQAVSIGEPQRQSR